MDAEFTGRREYDFAGNWARNSVSGSARVHQGHVINIFPKGDTSEEDTILNLLYSEYVGGKDRNSRRTPGTCKWVLGHEKFIRWRENPSAAALWVSAEPGSGKSVLSRALVDERLVCSGPSDQQADSESATICYFFFKDDNSSQNNAQAALFALLHQLFLGQPAAIEHAIS